MYAENKTVAAVTKNLTNLTKSAKLMWVNVGDEDPNGAPVYFAVFRPRPSKLVYLTLCYLRSRYILYVRDPKRRAYQVLYSNCYPEIRDLYADVVSAIAEGICPDIQIRTLQVNWSDDITVLDSLVGEEGVQE